jgi:hypothetical protein
MGVHKLFERCWWCGCVKVSLCVLVSREFCHEFVFQVLNMVVGLCAAAHVYA